MKCHCYETVTEFVFCVEDVEKIHEESVQAAWYHKSGDRFLKIYPPDINDKQLIKTNFSRLGESMFLGEGDWRKSLLVFAKRCGDGIEWYITGSASEAVMGVNIKPHDLDLVVRSQDFFRVKELFSEYMVEPFIDNKGTWIMRYFGRLCIEGVMVDVVADDKMKPENHQYGSAEWNGYHLNVEPLQTRYEIEIQRDRKDRIDAIDAFRKSKPSMI